MLTWMILGHAVQSASLEAMLDTRFLVRAETVEVRSVENDRQQKERIRSIETLARIGTAFDCRTTDGDETQVLRGQIVGLDSGYVRVRLRYELQTSSGVTATETLIACRPGEPVTISGLTQKATSPETGGTVVTSTRQVLVVERAAADE